MTLLLAPMEGLLDHSLREVLTQVGGVQRCVSEFIRVSGTLLPDKAFLRVVPELRRGSATRAGVLVRPQLLGSDPACLADNAAALAALGAEGIDLNFGCPAKAVNRHRGGAVLLDEPELLLRIVAQVRRAVPAHLPVSAKMRLGHLDDSRAEECALALQAGGAGELVVHARTKLQGYKPPAFWDRIADVRAVLHIPVVANGEVWSVQDARRCREHSGCDALMLGRGMVANPGLALAIAADQRGLAAPAPISWTQSLSMLQHLWNLTEAHVAPSHRHGRLKQWLNLLRRSQPAAQGAFDALRPLTQPQAVDQWLAAQISEQCLAPAMA